MTIKKYTGKTKDEAIQNAKEALGEGIVIMNTKNRKPEGLMGILKPSIWEVTVAIEEETDGSVSLLKKDPIKTSTFSALADEKIDYPPIGEDTYTPIRTTGRPAVTAEKPVIPTSVPVPSVAKEPTKEEIEAELKSAFREISLVVERDEAKKQAEKEKSLEKPQERPKEKPQVKTQDVPRGNPVEKQPLRKKSASGIPVVRMVYNTLIDNEVDERYINQIYDDMGNILTDASSVDLLISNIYQKMVLKMGSPKPIELSGKGPLVVFFVGPTGVGKTTTIAKIASMFKVNERKEIAFITSDTYRIAASDQLNVYANILDAPMTVIFDEEDALNKAVSSYKDKDLILVDTSGFSHNNEEQKATTKRLLSSLDKKYRSQKYLVLSVTTKYSDLKEISDAFRDICDYDLIFTKLDESATYGNILNLKLYTGAELSYVTNGQNVPDDIELIDTQKMVKGMLGGKLGSGH